MHKMMKLRILTVRLLTKQKCDDVGLHCPISKTGYAQDDETNSSFTDSQSYSSHKNDITFVIPV